MKSQIDKAEKEKLDNKTVFLSSAIILYAILVLFMQKMTENTQTVVGALTFINVLRWVSLAGAMICAAWSAYKENFGFFVYCGVCLFAFCSTTVILYCGFGQRHYHLNYIVLAIAFVLVQAYNVLKCTALWNRKWIKVLFIALCAVVFLTAVATSVYLWSLLRAGMR